MGDAFIVRRGGGAGAGVSKCTIIVHTETGSTVGIYSNSTATTLVKAGKEIGTSGSYVITGLEIGTYYAKAAKGTKSKISSAITFISYGVKEVTLPYELILFDGTSISDWGKNSYDNSQLINNQIELKATTTGSNYGILYYNTPIDVANYSTIELYGWGAIGDDRYHAYISLSTGATGDVAISDSLKGWGAADTPATKNFDISSLTSGQYYVQLRTDYSLSNRTMISSIKLK